MVEQGPFKAEVKGSSPFGLTILKKENKMRKIAKKILKMTDKEIKINFCKIMKKIMNKGGAESLINDDNGHWAIVGCGVQNVTSGDLPIETHTTFFIEQSEFSKTIPGALRIWAESFLKEDF